MKQITNFAAKFAYTVTLFTIAAVMGFIGLYLAVGSDLPEVESIREIRLQTPMSVYSKDGQLMNEFGDIRRIPITLDQVPKDFINALLSTEDQRFYEHSGVDALGVFRAALRLAKTGTKSQGASTITMLVARNYYLTREKRFSRKFTEMFVAWKLESELSKDEILEIFLNKIPFGHRSAGLGAASQVYYGKPLDQLNLAQLATLAGIPKGQSVFNPISNPKKARERRAHVLGRMLTEGHISQEQYEEANNQPAKTTRHGAKITVNAHYVSEMVHQEIIKQYGRDVAYSDGLKIYTSINPALQKYAQDALRSSLLEYDRRHGYRQVEQHYEFDESVTQEDMADWIADFPKIGDLIPALVIETTETDAEILLADGTQGRVLLQESLWARKYIDENHRETTKLTDISQIFVRGDVIRVLATNRFEEQPQKIDNVQSQENNLTQAKIELENDPENLVKEKVVPLPIYLLSQIPDVNGGFVVLDPKNGALQALVGGYNYSNSQFNMATQARRQLGSNIKPFIYAAALEKGFTAASLINDSPYIENDVSAGNFWRPENDSGRYLGPTRLREALSLSINTVAVRLINKFGPRYAKQYLENIGFPKSRIQPVPSLALGSPSFTPLEVATTYATLANGGYKVLPWFIERIEDAHGQTLYQHEPIQVCQECEQIIEVKEQQELEHQLLIEQQNELVALNSEINQELNLDEQVNTDTIEADLEQQSADTKKEELNTIQIDGSKIISNIPLLPIAEDKIAPRVIDERIRFIVDDMLKDVIHRGTAWRPLTNAKSPLLKRNDIAGKTGTTNDVKDAWFSGYNSQYVASAWVGFRDHSKKLGKREFGGRASLPIWQKFMEKSLAGSKQISIPRPDGIVDVKIDLADGKLASANSKSSDFEVFRVENAPTEYSETAEENVFDVLDESYKKTETEEESEQQEDEIDFD